MSTESSTTSRRGRSREAQAYLDGVGASLTDLPEDDRADLLEELATHLDELAAEGDAPLVSRLGSPEEYAAELRASAGLPFAHARDRAGARWRRRVETWLARPGAVSVREFLGSLRPFWWVVRGWVAGAVVAHLGDGPSWDYSFLPLPGGALGFMATVVAVVVSVQLGRGHLAVQWPRRSQVLALLNFAAVLALVPVLSSLSWASSQAGYWNDSMQYASEPQTVEVYPSEGVYANGTQVWNVYAYDAAGVMLSNVRLYDQDGNPLSLGLSFDSTKAQTLDARGRKVDNAFPYRYLDPTTGEVTDPAAGPAIVAPPLLGVPTPMPSAPPTPTPTPSPSASATKR